MTTEEKQLLIKDLCARLPYDVEAQVANNIVGESKPLIINKPLTFEDVNSFVGNGVVIDIKPYLRPMSSMTEEELQYIESHILTCDTESDFYLSRHIDYRGLIEKGLALEAKEGMYKTK